MNTYNTLVPVINNVIFDIQLIAVRASGFAFVKKKNCSMAPFRCYSSTAVQLPVSCISIFTIKLSIFIYFILLLLYSYNF